MQFKSFGSGSSGNCYYIAEGEEALLIDMGLGTRYFKKQCRDHGVPMHRIRALLVTHDHTDHSKCVAPFSHEMNIPVYALPEVFQGIRANPHLHPDPDPSLCRNVVCGEPFVVAGMQVTAFVVPHDSRGNVGYFVEAGGTNLCLMTDVGHVTEEMLQYIARADNLVIESNYDEEMLAHGPYPRILRERIASGFGHSSNAQTAAVLEHHLGSRTRRVFLCHLSENNNHPELARITVSEALQRAGLSPELVVLNRRAPSLLYEL
ncbi:MAG: MBL fold metallo-hydrolase [Alloprevotella sp.]|nr:MBL fold metallo-hydrolase [Alloprevotella sp.]